MSPPRSDPADRRTLGGARPPRARRWLLLLALILGAGGAALLNGPVGASAAGEPMAVELADGSQTVVTLPDGGPCDLAHVPSGLRLPALVVACPGPIPIAQLLPATTPPPAGSPGSTVPTQTSASATTTSDAPDTTTSPGSPTAPSTTTPDTTAPSSGGPGDVAATPGAPSGVGQPQPPGDGQAPIAAGASQPQPISVVPGTAPPVGKPGSSHGTGSGQPAGGSPTVSTLSGPLAPEPGAALVPGLAGPLIGVPDIFIAQFAMPPFLLPIYQAAGTEYGIPWQVLAAINEIETDYGRNLSVSPAGAVGWMQFLPSTWQQYGIDANADGVADPYDPVDAIFSAARYLQAAGGDRDIRQAIYAYNHASWYVDDVMLRAQLLGELPTNLIGALTGLTEGRFPVFDAHVRYTQQLGPRSLRPRASNASVAITSQPGRTSIAIYARAGAPVVAVNDGQVVRIGRTRALGRYVVLQDAYGNQYTYAHLGDVAPLYPVPRLVRVTPAQVARELRLPGAATADAGAATTNPGSATADASAATVSTTATAGAVGGASTATNAGTSGPAKERLFANPTRRDAYRSGGARQIAGLTAAATIRDFRAYFTETYGLRPEQVTLAHLRPGARVIAGTILGHLAHGRGPHIDFAVRPAGRGAPAIDPKPILDGWRLLAKTALYRATGRSPFLGPNAKDPTIGQLLLMSKEVLEQRVLADPAVTLYACGRQDIEAGEIDRRVLATLEYLVASGLDPTVSGLVCGHAPGDNAHAAGDAVTIAAINGIPILDHQGPGSIADTTIQRLLALQGTMRPDRISSLMSYPKASNTVVVAQDAGAIDVSFRPLFGANAQLGAQMRAILTPGQWTQLIQRLAQLGNPAVPTAPSSPALSPPS